MGQGFVGLARALRWVGLGSLGWAHLWESPGWVGLGGAKPGLPGESDECFCLRFLFFMILLCHGHYGNYCLSTQDSGIVFCL